MAPLAPGGPGRTRRSRRDRLDLGDRRCRVGAGEKGGSLTGPNPVDRGKKGSKLHVLSEAQGIPLSVAVSGANMHDSLALKPLVRGIPAIRSRRGPRRRRPLKLRADKAYFSADHLGCENADSSRASPGRASNPANGSAGTAGRSSGPLPGSSATAASPSDNERKGSHFLTFLGLAAVLTCYKKLAKLTT